MIIKTTLAYGRNFHFYQERFNHNYVYLELEDVPYDAGYRRVMVAIPIDVWEVIRLLASAQLNLADSSDADLLALVEEKVNERITTYEQTRARNPERANVLRFEHSIIFGVADEEREHQITRGLEYYKTERARQQGVATRMSQHRIIDIGN